MDKPLKTNDLRERMIVVINAMVTSSRHKYVWLEAQTGVQQEKWKKLCNRKQNPTAELIEALCILFPYYSEWIATGYGKNVQVNFGDQRSSSLILLWETKYAELINVEATRLNTEIDVEENEPN